MKSLGLLLVSNLQISPFSITATYYAFGGQSTLLWVGIDCLATRVALCIKNIGTSIAVARSGYTNKNNMAECDYNIELDSEPASVQALQ